MKRAVAAIAAAVLLAACAAGGKAPAPAKPIGPAVDEKVAKKDASGLVEEIYETINHGKPDSLFSLLNDPLIIFGPRKADGMVTRSEALVALGKLIDSKARSRAQVRSASLAVTAAQGGHSAWAFDIIDVEGKQLVGLAVLTNDDDLWALSAAALAHTPSMREIRAELKKVAVVPPGAMSPAKVDERAEGAVDKFKRGLLDQQVWGEDLMSSSDALLVGPATGDVTKGKKDIKRVWKKRMDAETRAAVSGEIAASTTPDGQLAWVTAPITRVEKDEEPLPLRAFAVFEKDGDSWKLIALQESLAVDVPGAGAAFVKVLPPPPKAAEPPPEPEKKIDKKAEAKKKKEEARKKKEEERKKRAEEKKKKAKKKADDDGDEVKPMKKAKKASSDDDDDEDRPMKKAKKASSDDDDDEDKPRKKAKRASDDDDDDEDKPKKKAKRASDDDDDDKPKKKAKRASDDDDDDDEDKPKKKKKKADAEIEDDDEDVRPKRRKKLTDDD